MTESPTVPATAGSAPPATATTGAADADADLPRRFGGLARLWGQPGAARVQQAHVVVVGVGGVGSWAVEALARSAVAALTLIDLDHVAESNINRQIQAHSGTLGQAKVLALQDRIRLIHPGCRLLPLEAFVDADNAASLLAQAAARNGPIHALIDACDQVQAKAALAHWAHTQGVWAISVGAAGGKRWAHRIAVADLAHVTHDPLLARLRQRLRKHHGWPAAGRPMRLPCVYSPEPITPPASAGCASSALGPSADGSLNCHGYGSLVTVTATMGLVAAGEALNHLAAPAGG